ncbi:MAG: ATP-binding cassette domain-containing protein [Parabacteroides sp.]|nr:ATP-binding cassette domain-containing protein [Parabacteroides sp.]
MSIHDLKMDAYANQTQLHITKTFSSEGIELSGGEGQKLSIARTIYKKAHLLILDEPTASLDAKAESEIYGEFFLLSKDKTVIFISHRLAAVQVSDNIAIFDKGRIAEYGSHKDLMKQNGLYTKVVITQSKPYVN